MTKHSNPAVRMNWSAALVSVLLGVLLFFGVFYLSNTSPAEAKSYPIVRSCQGLTVKQVGKNWVTVKKSNGSRVNYTGIAQPTQTKPTPSAYPGIYNIWGQRIQELQQGINIVDGKKHYIKK